MNEKPEVDMDTVNRIVASCGGKKDNMPPEERWGKTNDNRACVAPTQPSLMEFVVEIGKRVDIVNERSQLIMSKLFGDANIEPCPKSEDTIAGRLAEIHGTLANAVGRLEKLCDLL